MELHIDA